MVLVWVCDHCAVLLPPPPLHVYHSYSIIRCGCARCVWRSCARAVVAVTVAVLILQLFFVAQLIFQPVPASVHFGRLDLVASPPP
jgi:hypothetical protein